MHKFREEGVCSGYNLGFTFYSSWDNEETNIYDFSSSEVNLDHELAE